MVHEDVSKIHLWTPQLRHAEVIGGGKLRKGSVLRYTLALPGGKDIDVEMVHNVFDRPVTCSGEIVKGPVSGAWAWEYRALKAGTRVAYSTDLKVGGLLRLAGGMIAEQYAKAMRETLQCLKEYVEGGSASAR